MEGPDVGQFPPGFPKRSGWRRLGWRPAAHLLSWLCKPQVAQELRVTSQRVDLEAVESIGGGLLGLYQASRTA